MTGKYFRTSDHFEIEIKLKHCLLMSNRFGVYSAAEAVNAGLDLEMPGPPRLRGNQIIHALNSKKLSMYAIDNCVSNVLQLVNHCCKLGVPENAPEGIINTPETASLVRRVASSSIVLLKNEGDILPFKKEKQVCFQKRVYCVKIRTDAYTRLQSLGPMPNSRLTQVVVQLIYARTTPSRLMML